MLMHGFVLTDLPDFIVNYLSTTLAFAVHAFVLESQCYNISADFSMDNVCDYYANYTPIKLHLRRYNESDLVSVNVSSTAADVVIQWPEECSFQPHAKSPTTAISSGVTSAIVLAIVVILAVVTAIGSILVYRRKTIQKLKMAE